LIFTYCEYQDIIESSAGETKGSGGHKMRWNKDWNIDEYIAGFPENIQEKLKQIRQVIKESAPGAREAISYGMPTYKQNGTWCTLPLLKTISAFSRRLRVSAHSRKNYRFMVHQKGQSGFLWINPSLLI
jgi:uncharacterized protein YdhG (YjbR/CyaY superfamily)